MSGRSEHQLSTWHGQSSTHSFTFDAVVLEPTASLPREVDCCAAGLLLRTACKVCDVFAWVRVWSQANSFSYTLMSHCVGTVERTLAGRRGTGTVCADSEPESEPESESESESEFDSGSDGTCRCCLRFSCEQKRAGDGMKCEAFRPLLSRTVCARVCLLRARGPWDLGWRRRHCP